MVSHSHLRVQNYLFCIFYVGLISRIESKETCDDERRLLGPEHINTSCISIRSLQRNRSPDNAYIVLLGLTGVGKSSTINRLFNQSFALVGEDESTTSEIVEYSTAVEIQGEKNSHDLRILDTPGLEDTRGDARFLATLDDFLENHEDLENRYPNVVLIFGRFDDNRYEGESSKFVRMLRAIELRRHKLIDPFHSNVIFVLTHLLGVPDRESRNPMNKLQRFKTTIKMYSKFKEPLTFVFAENKGVEETLPETKDGFVLPNGQIYPLNLFTEIKNRMEANGDSLGLNVITQAFVSKANIALRERSRTPLLSQESPRTAKILQDLTSANFLISTTNVSKILAKTYQNLPRSFQRTGGANLPYIQRVLHIRGIMEPSQIPRADYAVAALFRDFGANSIIYELLKRAFRLEMSVAPFISEKTIGYSYNSLESISFPITPFDGASMKPSKHSGSLGFKIPNILNCKADTSQKLFVKKLKSSESSILEEYRLHSCELDQSEYTLQFSTYFRKRLSEVGSFNESNYESLTRWNKFIREFGTHAVTSAYIGGSIEVLLKSKLAVPPKSLTNLDSDSDQILKITGGNFRYKTENLRSMFGNIPSLLTQWKQSLVDQSSILTSELTLMPLYIFVERILKKPAEAVRMETAIKYLMTHKDVKRQSNEEVLQKSKAEIFRLSESLNTCKTNYSRSVLEFHKKELEKDLDLKSMQLKFRAEQNKNAALIGEKNTLIQQVQHLRRQITNSDTELVGIKRQLRRCISKSDTYDYKLRTCRIRNGEGVEGESKEISSSSEEIVAKIPPVDDRSEEIEIIPPTEDSSEEMATNPPIKDSSEEIATNPPIEDSSEEIAPNPPIEDSSEEIATNPPIEDSFEEIEIIPHITEDSSDEIEIIIPAEVNSDETPVETSSYENYSYK